MFTFKFLTITQNVVYILSVVLKLNIQNFIENKEKI